MHLLKWRNELQPLIFFCCLKFREHILFWHNHVLFFLSIPVGFPVIQVAKSLFISALRCFSRFHTGTWKLWINESRITLYLFAILTVLLYLAASLLLFSTGLSLLDKRPFQDWLMLHAVKVLFVLFCWMKCTGCFQALIFSVTCIFLFLKIIGSLCSYLGNKPV